MRFKKTLCCLVLAVPLLTLFGCAENVLPEEVTKDGAHLEIILEENPTTGYSWTMDDYDTSLLKLEKDEYSASTTEGAVGSGGTHLYRFTGQKEGNITLIFRYYRNWEGKDTAVEVREYSITVADDGKIQSVDVKNKE
ncbi:protease inhibitor I42 family protein [Proteiniclasticum ruminis]|uniref:Predicted secreted protein n=1 Tax=Proteiniclasticum ruminis TaxID=398199 RepID=A0A1I4Y1W3_9CLOT|nr:protease inhibitor I42 family protein [Proteiniclasticum ruminis]SFN32108.1 Predicted secreted protein [Proteiniclasticum ruminis]